VILRTLAPAAGAAALVVVSTSAQLVPRIEVPLRSGIDLTVVTATVFNAEGGLATGLERDAFDVYEDGLPVTIAQFTNERVPIGLGLLLDVSDSMFGRRIVEARAAVQRFLLDLLSPADEYFLIAFNQSPRPLTDWTRDPGVVHAALQAARPSGGTALYDAIASALPTLERRRRQRAALVVISDGADTASDTTLRELRSELQRSDAFVYAIAIDSPDPQPINTRVNPTALGDVTNPTGGHTEVIHDSADLAAATARIADELNSQYVLGYITPHPRDGQYHTIRVRVKIDGYKVKARNGYVAVPVQHR
jgi:Ca-activated chloride channel family protein